MMTRRVEVESMLRLELLSAILARVRGSELE